MFRFDRFLSVFGGGPVVWRTGRYYNSVHEHHAVYIRSKVGAPARRVVVVVGGAGVCVRVGGQGAQRGGGHARATVGPVRA